MSDGPLPECLSQLAAALGELPAEEGLAEALAVAGRLGFRILARAEGAACLTIQHGERRVVLAQPEVTALSDDERKLLLGLVRLALRRVDEDLELRRTRERLTLLSEASFEGLFYHVDGNVLGANRRLVELTGYDESEVLGTTLMPRCVAPEDLPSVLERMANRYEGSYVISGVRKDGSRFRAELQAKQGKLGDQPVRVVAVRDVTQRERMEQLLRESEMRLRQLAEASFDIIVFSQGGAILEMYGPVEQVFGYAREEMVGRKILDFVDDEASLTRIGAMLSQGLRGTYEALARRKDREQVPLEIVAIETTRWNGATVRMAALRDLRAAKQLERERRALEQAFERSQRLDSLGVLAGGIAHDFNNLLTAILGSAELLQHRLAQPELRDMAQSILDASQRASALTAQMLAYAGRNELGPRAPVDLGMLVSDLRELLAATLSKKAQVSLDCEPKCLVLGNRATLSQVLMNLLTNASDALEGKVGAITVRTRRLAHPDQRWTRALGNKVGPGNWVLLEVSDTGVGMTEQVQARIFEPFFSTKAKGHGLGLAACVGIVSSHGGAILVQSDKGKGSTFSVLLPAHEAPSAPEATPKPASAPETRKVLVVDDEPLVRTHMRNALQSQDYEVEEASGGRAALEALERVRPSLIVLDLTMPDLSGVEVLRLIREWSATVPVILTSGYHDAALHAATGEYQAFLAKPYTLPELLGAVERALSAAP